MNRRDNFLLVRLPFPFWNNADLAMFALFWLEILTGLPTGGCLSEINKIWGVLVQWLNYNQLHNDF